MPPAKKGMSLSWGASLLALVLLFLYACFPGKQSKRLDDPITTLRGHRFPVQALAFSPDGNTLTTVACLLNDPREEMELLTWDLDKGSRRTGPTELPGQTLCLAFSRDGKALAAMAGGGTVRVWDTSARTERRRFGTDRVVVSALAFAPDGSRLATPDQEGNVVLWNAGGELVWVRRGQKEFPTALAFSPDGTTLASGCRPTIQLWDVATGEGRGTLPGPAWPVTALAFSLDGQTLASGGFASTVNLWNLGAGTEQATLKTSGEQVTDLVFSPDGRLLAIATDRAVELWNVAERRLQTRLVGHEGQVKCLAFSPNGKRLASGGFDQTVRLWDVER
jgi:WD40 repeat protein